MQTIKKIYAAIRRVLSTILKEQPGLYAAQASFFLIISFVPLLMLLVGLLQFIFPFSQQELLDNTLPLLPESIHSFAISISNDLFSNQTVSIISLSTLMLLWSASRGVHSVTRGLRHLYGAQDGIYYRERLRAIVYTVALILTVLFALIVLVFGNTLWGLLTASFPWLQGASVLVSIGKFLLSAVLITFFALLLYCACVPREVAKFRLQFPGALFTAAGWILFSTGFSLYIVNFSNYSFLYGSLAAIILLMLWLYICMWLLFLGAQVNRALIQRQQNARQVRLQ